MVRAHRGRALALAAAAAVALAPGAVSAQSISVPIRPLGQRQEHGSATFTQQGRDVIVRIEVSGTPDAMQLVHIHAGTCASPGRKTIFMLDPIRNGRSVTTLRGTNLQFFREHPYTIGLHTVRAHVSTHAACGGPIGRS